MKTLKSEKYLEGLNKTPKITSNGWKLLYDLLPDEFDEPQELNLVQDENLPF